MKQHRNVTPEQEALAERNLFTAVAALRSAEECRAFFKDLCTPAELQAMADRWAVVDWPGARPALPGDPPAHGGQRHHHRPRGPLPG